MSVGGTSCGGDRVLYQELFERTRTWLAICCFVDRLDSGERKVENAIYCQVGMAIYCQSANAYPPRESAHTGKDRLGIT